MSHKILHGPMEMVLGIGYGIVGGLVLWILPNFREDRCVLMQFGLLTLGGMLAVFGSTAVEMGGAGALGALTIAFVTGKLL